MSLADWFPDQDHRFQMRFERGTIAGFFKPSELHPKALAERRHWLRSNPEQFTALLPEGVALLQEAVELAQREGTLLPDALGALAGAKSPADKCRHLGESWEPDFVLLCAGADGVFRVAGGCVCFPSSWSLAEKLGHRLEFVHSPVPGLNAALGRQIQSFLSQMKSGLAWQRLNWGLSRTAELNQHPSRNLPPLDVSIPPEEIFLRVEDQALVRLPETQGVLFGIRVTSYPLSAVKTDRLAAPGR